MIDFFGVLWIRRCENNPRFPPAVSGCLGDFADHLVGQADLPVSPRILDKSSMVQLVRLMP